MAQMITYEILGLMMLVVTGCGYTSYKLGFRHGVLTGHMTVVCLVKEYISQSLGGDTGKRLFANDMFENWMKKFMNED
jgi:hypothetical protein